MPDEDKNLVSGFLVLDFTNDDVTWKRSIRIGLIDAVKNLELLSK